MAEDDKKGDEAQEGEGGSKKKLIIIIAIVAVLAIGVSVGVTVFLLGGDSEEVAAEAVPAEPVKEPFSYYDIKPPFLVTFNVDGRQRYMQISVSAASRDASSLDGIDTHMPVIRSQLLAAYADQDFEFIRTEDGKIALQEKTVEVINKVLSQEGGGEIENIFFTNFVLQ